MSTGWYEPNAKEKLAKLQEEIRILVKETSEAHSDRAEDALWRARQKEKKLLKQIEEEG